MEEEHRAYVRTQRRLVEREMERERWRRARLEEARQREAQREMQRRMELLGGLFGGLLAQAQEEEEQVDAPPAAAETQQQQTPRSATPTRPQQQQQQQPQVQAPQAAADQSRQRPAELAEETTPFAAILNEFVKALSGEMEDEQEDDRTQEKEKEGQGIAQDPEEPVVTAAEPAEGVTSPAPTTTAEQPKTTTVGADEDDETDGVVSFLNQLVPDLGTQLSSSGFFGRPPSSAPGSATTTAEKKTRRTDNVADIIDQIIPGFGFGQAFKEASESLEKQESEKREGEEQARYTQEEKGKAVDRVEPVEQKSPEVPPAASAEAPSDVAEEVEPIEEPATSNAPAESIPATPASEAPAEAPAVSLPTDPNVDSAAKLIQAKYRQHLLRVRRLEKLDNLKAKLDKVTAAFEFPKTLEFSSPSSVPSSPSIDPVDGSAKDDADHSLRSVPSLAFTPTNHAYHAHAHALLQLLTAADSIQSDGDQEVRQARKDFVKLVESKLAEMEIKRSLVWKEIQAAEQRQQEDAVPVDAPKEDEEQAVEHPQQQQQEDVDSADVSKEEHAQVAEAEGRPAETEEEQPAAEVPSGTDVTAPTEAEKAEPVAETESKQEEAVSIQHEQPHDLPERRKSFQPTVEDEDDDDAKPPRPSEEVKKAGPSEKVDEFVLL